MADIGGGDFSEFYPAENWDPTDPTSTSGRMAFECDDRFGDCGTPDLAFGS